MKSKKGRIIKILLIALFAIVLGLKLFGEPFLEKKITQWQPKNKHIYYNIDIGKVDVKILRGVISVTDFNLSLNQDFFKNSDSLKMPHLYEIRTDLKIKLINAFQLIFFNELKISKVYFENANITWYPGFNSQKVSGNDTISENNTKKFKSLGFGNIEVENAKIIIKDKVGEQGVEIVNVDSVDLDIHKLFVNFDAQDSKILPRFEEVTISTGAFDFEYDSNSFQYGDFWLNAFYESEKDQYLIDVNINKLNALLGNEKGKITAESLFVLNLNFENFLLDKKIIADSIKLTEANVDLVIADESKNSEDDSLIATKGIDSIKIQAFVLDNGWIRIKDKNQKEKVSIDSLALILSNINTVLSSPESTTFKGTLMKSGAIHSNLNNYYDVSLRGITFITETQKLNLDNFKLIPRHSREAFSSIIPYEQDLFTISIDSINVLFENSFRIFEKEVLLDKVNIYQLKLDVYRDKWVEDPPFMLKKLPAELIASIPIPIHIKQIESYNSSISYSQYGDMVQNEIPGKFELSDLHLKITNISNIDSILQHSSLMKVDIKANMMSAGKLTTELRFNLKNTNQYFKATGNLERLPMVRLTPFLMGILSVEIPDGVINNLDFDMEANREYMKGKMTLEYQDLHVIFHKAKKQGKASSFTSFLANTAVKKHNIKGEKGYKEAVIFSEVVKNKFIFNNLWQGIKSGVMDILVITSNQEKSLEKYEKMHTDLIQ